MVAREVILSVVGVILAFPAGLVMARLTRDELVKGRKFFEMLIIAALFTLFASFFIEDRRLTFALMLTMVFTIIVSLISLYKSFDRNFLRA